MIVIREDVKDKSKGAHIKSQIEGEWLSGLNVPQA